MPILVIGSTGQVGSEVVNQLLSRNAEVRALVHEEKPELPREVKLIRGDINDIDAMRKALAGITTLFLLNPVVPDELSRALVCLDLAVEAGVKGVVYFSMFHSDIFLDCPHASAKYATEQMIRYSELPTTILRPNYFFQNDATSVLKSGIYMMPIGSLGVSMVDVRDIAEVAALSLIERENAEAPLPTKIIEIHGPDVMTSESAVALWSNILGKKVAYPGDDLRAAEERFRSTMPSAAAYDVVSMFRGFQRHGMVADPKAVDSVRQLLGRPLRTYRQYAEEAAKAA